VGNGFSRLVIGCAVDEYLHLDLVQGILSF
jgi:hypothetical protein